MIQCVRWDEATQSLVRDEVSDDVDLRSLLDGAREMLRGARGGNPSVELVRSGGSTLTLATDGSRCLLVWVDSSGDSMHSVGGGDGLILVFDYAGSWSEAPDEWTVPLTDALVSARRFIDMGSPVTDDVLFEED